MKRVRSRWDLSCWVFHCSNWSNSIPKSCNLKVASQKKKKAQIYGPQSKQSKMVLQKVWKMNNQNNVISLICFLTCNYYVYYLYACCYGPASCHVCSIYTTFKQRLTNHYNKKLKKKITKKMEMKSKWFSVFLNSLELEGWAKGIKITRVRITTFKIHGRALLIIIFLDQQRHHQLLRVVDIRDREGHIW